MVWSHNIALIEPLSDIKMTEQFLRRQKNWSTDQFSEEPGTAESGKQWNLVSLVLLDGASSSVP